LGCSAGNVPPKFFIGDIPGIDHVPALCFPTFDRYPLYFPLTGITGGIGAEKGIKKGLLGDRIGHSVVRILFFVSALGELVALPFLRPGAWPGLPDHGRNLLWDHGAHQKTFSPQMGIYVPTGPS